MSAKMASNLEVLAPDSHQRVLVLYSTISLSYLRIR